MDDHKEQQTQQHIDHELTRAIDKLGDAFHLIKDVFSDNQKRYESLAHEIRQDQEKEGRRQRRDAWLIAMISIVGIGSSVIAASFWSYKQEQVALQKTQIAALYSEAHSIQRKIDDELKLRNELMDAMVNVRGVRDFGQKQCKNGVYEAGDKVEYTQKLYAANYALLSAAYNTTGVFDQDKIIRFLSLVNLDQYSVCDKKTVSGNELSSLQADINREILQRIEKAKQTKEDVIDRINNVESKNT